MEIKIEIPQFSGSETLAIANSWRNQFAEVAFFIDCPTIQDLIIHYKHEIQLQSQVSYDIFNIQSGNVIIKYELTKEQEIQLYEINSDIINFEDRLWSPLSEAESLEYKALIEKRSKLMNPYIAFRDALSSELNRCNKSDFLDILTYAIICGEIRKHDWINIITDRKGTRKAIYEQRVRYWWYQRTKASSADDKGYGTAAKSLGIKTVKTFISSVTTYKRELEFYDNQLKSIGLFKSS